jgi:PleD family two-component response regulator
MCTVVNQQRQWPTSLWAYAYQIVPPQPTHRLDTIRELLGHEHAAARQEARTWASRLVLERRATRILIVSDSPDQERRVDHTLVVELQRLEATFCRTESMEIQP